MERVVVVVVGVTHVIVSEGFESLVEDFLRHASVGPYTRDTYNKWKQYLNKLIHKHKSAHPVNCKNSEVT